MKDGKLGFGIVGCGVIAPFHRDAIKANAAEADLIAVSDVEEAKGRKFAEEIGPGVAFYRDYQEMLRRDDIDAVCVCTPSGLHGEVTVAAAEAGKHVLSEKPLEITLPKIDRMIQTCRERRVKLAGVFQRRTHPDSQRVREAVQRGDLGQITLGDAYLKYYRSQGYYESAGWRGTWALDGGGALMNQGVHGIDLLLWIVGDVATVYAKSKAMVRKIEVEDTAVALVTYRSGAFGVIEGTTSCNPGETTRTEVHGKLGTIVLTDRGIQRWAVAEGEDDRAKDLPVDEIKPSGGGAVTDPKAISGRGHVFHVADLIRAVKEDRDPFVTGESGRKAVELILAIYESSKTGREVELPLRR